ncbi:MAG TPA: NAD(P)/FAD-dependent oxidoreductase [Streptosporangiaceae bacterium]|jgi:dihydrolipoamide dehydrogenase
MVVGELAEGVDVLVVGGGPGGRTAALRAAQAGRQVVLVDRAGSDRTRGRGPEGGPSVAALAEVAGTAHRAAQLRAAGLLSGETTIDLARFQDGQKQHAGDVHAELRRPGIRVIEGTLAFNRPDRAAVATPDGNVTFLEFTTAVVAPGSVPAELPGLTPDGDRVLGPAGALALRAVPASLTIVGGGPTGTELATLFAMLGTEVTLIEAAGRLLPQMPEIVATPVHRALAGLGVRLMTGTEAAGLDGVTLVVRSGGPERQVPAERVVVAAGLRPDTRDLGLAAAGVPTGPGGQVVVDGTRRASARIFAAGDVTGQPCVAHKAAAEATVAAAALNGRPATFDPLAIPVVLRAGPGIAAVGLTEDAARAAGLRAVTARAPLPGHSAASGAGAAPGAAPATAGAPDGFVQLTVDLDRDVVVGAHMAGPHAAGLAGEAALAVEMMASPEDLAATLHPCLSAGAALAGAAARLAREHPPSGR